MDGSFRDGTFFCRERNVGYWIFDVGSSRIRSFVAVTFSRRSGCKCSLSAVENHRYFVFATPCFRSGT